MGSRDPLRVAIMFGSYPPARNGGADFVERFARALAGRGIVAHVVTGTHPAASKGAGAEAPVVVHRIVDDWSIRDRRSLRRVNEVLRRERIDILHAFFPDSAVGGRYQLPPLAGLGRVPLVTTWWNLGLGRRSPVGLRLASLALVARSRVLTTHDPGYLRALRFLALGRTVAMLPVGNNLGSPANGVDVRARWALGDAPILGFFGHLDFTRGIEDLFAAVAELRRSRDIRLLMIGAGDAYPEFRQLPAALGIEDAVVWTGYLEPAEAASALAGVDLCVLPYRRNSVGRSALAASLTLGVPTLLAGSPADVQPLVPGRDVAISPRADPAALALAIAVLLDDPAGRAALASGGRAAAAAFAWPAIAERAEAIYRSVLRP